MTPSFVSENFVRMMDCAAQALLAQLPGALPKASLTFDPDVVMYRSSYRGLFAAGPEDHGANPTRTSCHPQLIGQPPVWGADDNHCTMQKHFDLGTHRGGG
jgi:hypothetical protein